MVFQKLVLILFFSLLSLSAISQEQRYYDENMKKIDSAEFMNRCSFRLFKCFKYETDTLIVYKVLFKHAFGKISKIEYNQIIGLVSKDSGQKLDKNETIIVKYIDSLSNYTTKKKNYERHVSEHKFFTYTLNSIPKKKKVRHKPFNKKTHQKNLKKWTKTQNKCIKKFERNDHVKVFHLYKYGEDELGNYPNFKLVKDRSVFKNMFFNIRHNYRFFVLKPNGDYFLSGGHLGDKKLNEILKNDDWTSLKKDWQTTINKYYISGYGFFEKEKYHEKHCF